MHKRPGRQQEHRVLALAVDLPEDALAVALGEALAVGVARARLLARDIRAHGLLDDQRPVHRRASNTRLNGVCAARRKRVKPPAMTTSRIFASPACAPSASPTSWDR